MSSDSQNENSNNEFDENGLDSFINNEFNDLGSNKIEMNLDNTDTFNFDSSNTFKYSQRQCDPSEGNYEEFGNFTHQFGDNEYECEDEYDPSTSFNGATSFSFDISSEIQPKSKGAVVDIPLDEFDEDTDFKTFGVSEDDEHDYKMTVCNNEKEAKDEAHHLSSPYSNGLVALRIEMTPNDGGVKAEELKSSELFQNKSEVFKDVIIEKNIQGNEDDIVCNICLDGDPYQNDEIVFCEVCSIAVHQSCYGSEIVDTLPTHDWFCHRCVHCIKNSIHPNSIRCIICPNLEGPLKRINEDNWAHVSCINWIAELWYKNDKYKEGIVIQSLQKWRTSHKCKICDSKYGAVILCDYGKCNYMFHPTCGIKEELILDWEEMSEMLKLPEDADMCPIYCPKHLQLHIDNVKAGITDSAFSKYQKNKQPTKKPKKKKNKSSFYIEESNNFNVDFDGNVDISLSNDENDSDGSISPLELEDEEFNETKESKLISKKPLKKKTNSEELEVARIMRDQEKQRKQQERIQERERIREERKFKQEQEKQERAIERKQRKEIKKAQKVAKLKEQRKVVIRKPTMIINENRAEITTSNQWKTFMEMGKKREQEILDQKNAKRTIKEKKRQEKENKKKDEDKKKVAVVLAAKHQKVENKPKNEAFELAKKQYIEEMKKKNSAIVIKTKKSAKQMLRSVPKNIIKRKADDESLKPVTISPSDQNNIKEETCTDILIKNDKPQYEKVHAGNFKFQKVQEVEVPIETPNNEQEVLESKKREFVNKPTYNIRNVEVQQSLKNFCNKNKQIHQPKQEDQVEIHESKTISNPFFMNLNVNKQKVNLGPQRFINQSANHQSISIQTEDLVNSCNLIVNPVIKLDKDIILLDSTNQDKDRSHSFDSFSILSTVLSRLKECLLKQNCNIEKCNYSVNISGLDQINFIFCTNCNKCIDDNSNCSKVCSDFKHATVNFDN